MEVPLTFKDLSLLGVACDITIESYQTPEMEGKFGPTAIANVVSEYRLLKDKIEQITLSI